MTYRRRRCIEEEAPELGDADVMTMTEARKVLGVTHSALNNLVAQDHLTIILDYGRRTAFLKPKRLLLRDEVERLRQRLPHPYEARP